MMHACERKVLLKEREQIEAMCFIPFFAPRPVRRHSSSPFTPYFAPLPGAEKKPHGGSEQRQAGT
jgi:hypothetical protein